MEEKRSYGAVIPATILILIGIIFLLDSLGWGPGMDKLWPIFILAPGISFLLMFFCKKIAGKKSLHLFCIPKKERIYDETFI